MAVKPDMIGMAVKDMAATLSFYRLLGLDIPAGVEGEPHVDGGLHQPLPIESAFERGCTHVLALTTVRADYRAPAQTLPLRLMLRPFIGRWPLGLREHFWYRRPHAYNRALDLAAGRARPDGAGVELATLYPCGPRISRTTVDRDLVRRAADACIERVSVLLRELTPSPA